MKAKFTPISIEVCFLLVLFVLVVVRRAWVSDDAYITFRTIDNFIRGDGLVWNVGERVQVYTHPLWMFLLAGGYALTREIHFTSLVISILISAIAITLFALRVPKTQTAGLFGVLILILSKAFVDYSTSGLENPLSHLILIVFVVIFLSSSVEQKYFWLALLSSLLLLTRLDLALILAPPLIDLLYRDHKKQALKSMILGGIPLLVWELFSLFYYGFPLPNTFYAKINTGIPQVELTHQGIQYFLNILEFDPLTLLIIFLGIATVFVVRERRLIALGLGSVLYMMYVVRIGGDFMAGRFFTIPLLVSVVILSQLNFEDLATSHMLMVFGVTLAMGLGVPHATLNFQDTDTLQTPVEHVVQRGISDERLNYAPFTAPLALSREAQPPTHVWAWQGTRDSGKGRELITKFGIGFYGFNAGPKIYVIDQLALADPLLARLPSARDIHWRVGHYVRVIPAGYERTLESGSNQIKDPGLALYYEKLSLITRGPLWSRTRLIEVFKINAGYYDDLINWHMYRYPDQVRVKFNDSLTLPKVSTLPWNSPEMIVFGDSGLEIDFGQITLAPWVEISLSSDDDFEFVYVLAGKELAFQVITAAEYPEGGLAVYRLKVPAPAQESGFDALRILPISGEEFSLGYLSLQFP